MSIVNEINFFFDNTDSAWQRQISNLDAAETIKAMSAIGVVVSIGILFTNFDVVRGWHIFFALIYGAVCGATIGVAISILVFYLIKIIQAIFWILVVVVLITIFIIFLGSIIWQR